MLLIPATKVPPTECDYVVIKTAYGKPASILFYNRYTLYSR